MRISDWSSDVCSSDLLVLTQEVAGGGDGEPLKVSETIMRNLRVLATDQRTDPVGEDGKREVMTYSNVTLEVTPKIAEKIAVAQTIGTLSLSLRSIADTRSELEQAIAAGAVTITDDPTEDTKMLHAIARQPVDQRSPFPTGTPAPHTDARHA